MVTHPHIVLSQRANLMEIDCIPNKLECIGHVQKRVGSRLRMLKNTNKGVKLSDGKGFGGKGRLTDSKLDILQNNYGLAVRSNLDDVDKMAIKINIIPCCLEQVKSSA